PLTGSARTLDLASSEPTLGWCHRLAGSRQRVVPVARGEVRDVAVRPDEDLGRSAEAIDPVQAGRRAGRYGNGLELGSGGGPAQRRKARDGGVADREQGEVWSAESVEKAPCAPTGVAVVGIRCPVSGLDGPGGVGVYVHGVVCER